MFSSHSCCNAKIYEKNCVEWRNSYQQLPEKDQSYVKVGRNNIHIEVLKLWVRLWSIFHCNVNSEFMSDEQWMKKTPQDSTLDYFWFLSKNFFSKIWAAKFRVWLICGCGLSAGAAYLQVRLICRYSLSVDFYGNTYLIEHANHSLEF